MREATSPPASSSVGLKRSQAQQGHPVRMTLAGHQLAWAFALTLGMMPAKIDFAPVNPYGSDLDDLILF